MKLPEPVRELWLNTRDVLHEQIERYIDDFQGWKMHGGTVLAARWGHRDSTDIDLKVDEKAGLALLNPRRNPGFDAAMRTLGAVRAPNHGPRKITIHFPNGRIDLGQGRLPVPYGHVNETIDGKETTVFSNTQILAGKILGRSMRSPTRDVFDIAVAKRLDRASLEAATNMIISFTHASTRETIRLARRTHMRNAQRALRNVPERFRREKRDPATHAVDALESCRYVNLDIEVAHGSLAITTECQDGTIRVRENPTTDRNALRKWLHEHAIPECLDAAALNKEQAVLARLLGPGT